MGATKKPLTETHPEVARDWLYAKNGSFLPADTFATSKDKAWWRCQQGHEYQVSVYSRVRSKGCKVCQKANYSESSRLTKLAKSGSLTDENPDFLAQWDREKNGDLTPDC